MWLLFFLCDWWFRCDSFDCSAPDTYRCCVNKTTVYTTIKEPGHYCDTLTQYKSDPRDLPLGTGYWCCQNYKYIPPSTPQLTPQISRTFMPTSTPARTYAKLSVKCQSKTKTDLLATLATSVFD